jgi:hypothetical protein
MPEFKVVTILVTTAALMLVGSILAPASASTITYPLTSDFCSGGCGTPPFGAVTVSSISSTEVSVNLTLAPHEVFAVSGAGDALLFDLSGNPSINVSSLTFGFTATQTASGGNSHADGTGNWQYSIDCTGCGNGTSPPQLSGPLNFDVTVAGGIAPSSFIQNGSGLFFATDIGTGCNPSCSATGDVGAPTAVVPAPLIGHGLFVLLAVGGVLLGGKLLETWKKHRLHAA